MSTATEEPTALDILCRIWEEGSPHHQDRSGARETIQKMARTIIGLDDFAVMDTETTGTGPHDEVVEVAVISATGDTIFHSLVRPSRSIPAQATSIHGISSDDVRTAPTISEVATDLLHALNEKFVMAYNADFDFRLLNQSLEGAGLVSVLRRRSRPWDAANCPHGAEVAVDSACVMRMYAAWHGEWDSFHKSYTYQKLTKAVADFGLDYGGEAHGALADARAALAVLRHMATTDIQRG